MGNFNRGGGKPSFGGKRSFGGGGSRFGGKPSFGGRDGGRPMLHSATCSECGNDCQVPFKPTGERPVFCNACFGKQQDGPGDARPRKFGHDRPRFNDDRRERPARFGGGGSRFGGKPSFGGRPMLHSATCSECGNDCQVPFKPTGERPVFCNACFGKQQDGPGNARPNKFGGDRPRFNDDRRERPARFSDAQAHTAVCSKCGKECQVPFKPMPGKSVFCNDCFEKPGAKDAGELLRQVEALHAKFDKLMKMLAPNTVAEKTAEPEAKKEKVKIKKTAAKKKK